MPVYDFRCNSCGVKLTIYRKIADRDNPEPHCGGLMQRLIVAPAVHPEITPYQSPVTGKWVNSRAQRHEELVREGCILREPGIDQDIARNRAAAQEAVLATVDKTIDQTASALHAAGHI